jgi:hypothetical protein
MSRTKNAGQAHADDAFMLLMNAGSWPQRPSLYDAYEKNGGWLGVHDELVKMLRVAARKRNLKQSDQLARALRDVWQYHSTGYGLGRCSYVPAAPIPKGATADEIEEHENRGAMFSKEAIELGGGMRKFFSHYFLSASARRIPAWCPAHSPSGRARKHRRRSR